MISPWKHLLLLYVLWKSDGNVGALASTAVPPSVGYIESEYFGNFFIVEGKIPVGTVSLYSFSTRTLCDCRTACWADPKCRSLTTKLVDGKIQCQLYDIGPLTSTLANDSTVTYIFTQRSIEEQGVQFHGVLSDHFLYIVVLNDFRAIQPARDYCQNIPGFRLGMYKTLESYSILKYIAAQYPSRWPWVDLEKKKTGGGYIWGDQTPVSDAVESEMDSAVEIEDDASTKPFFVMSPKGILYDQIPGHPERIICQANPLGLEW